MKNFDMNERLRAAAGIALPQPRDEAGRFVPANPTQAFLHLHGARDAALVEKLLHADDDGDDLESRLQRLKAECGELFDVTPGGTTQPPMMNDLIRRAHHGTP